MKPIDLTGALTAQQARMADLEPIEFAKELGNHMVTVSTFTMLAHAAVSGRGVLLPEIVFQVATAIGCLDDSTPGTEIGPTISAVAAVVNDVLTKAEREGIAVQRGGLWSMPRAVATWANTSKQASRDGFPG